MTIDPVKIPQNVYVEDRIIGSITLRQIIICLLTGGLSYGLFSSMKAAGAMSIVTGVLSWTPLVIGAAFAFVKINGISLTRFCLLMLEKMDKPAIRVWAPRRGITISIGAASVKTDKEATEEKRMEEAKRRAEEKRKRIHELSDLLDKGPEEVDDQGHAIERTAPAASSLPVDKSRVSAEPLESSAPFDAVQPPSVARALIRDIAPPSSL